MNEVLKTIANRRSIRHFKPDQIPDDSLRAILETAKQAPSGHNDQSCYFVAIQNKELIDELSAGSKVEMQKSPIGWMAAIGRSKAHIYHQAPTAIIIAARKEAISPVADVCAAVENMLLAAESLGLGSCWIGFTRFYFNAPERQQKLGIPDGYEVYYGVALGYKSEEFSPQPPERKMEQVRIIK